MGCAGPPMSRRSSSAGVARVVLGTAAAEDPDGARSVAAAFPGRVALGLDYRLGASGRAEVASRGWLRGTGRTVAELLDELADAGLAALVVTAIDRDGTLAGPDLDGLAAVLAATALPVIASGGVSSVDDLRALAALEVGSRRREPGAGGAGERATATGKDRAAPVRGHHRPGPGRRPAERGRGGGGVRTVRVIPCLDVDAGRVVKGVRFTDLFDAGDPVELARRYDEQGADELVFLDITASSDDRRTMVDVVARTAEVVFIPLTVGGGVRSVEDARRLLRAGADKVGVNTAAVDRPELVAALADEFGSQCVVVAVDARRRPAQRATGRSAPTAGGRPPASTRWAGRPGWQPAGPARSCSPPWTATAPATASTSSSPRRVADAVRGAGHRLGRGRHARPSRRGGASSVMPTRCWPPPSSISASSRWPRPRSDWPRPASPCVRHPTA